MLKFKKKKKKKARTFFSTEKWIICIIYFIFISNLVYQVMAQICSRFTFWDCSNIQQALFIINLFKINVKC